MVCKYCGYEMKHKDYVKRKIKTGGDHYNIVTIERQFCIECHKYVRVYPNNVPRYKQYSRAVIVDALTRSDFFDDIRYEDYPSIQTVKNWKSDKKSYAR